MSYHKMTIVSGSTDAPAPDKNLPYDEWQKLWGEHHRATVLAGHWKPESALKIGRRMGMTGQINVTHKTADMSGKGYGGYDAKFQGDESGFARVELSDYEKEYDDAADVNDLYDEAEGR